MVKRQPIPSLYYIMNYAYIAPTSQGKAPARGCQFLEIDSQRKRPTNFGFEVLESQTNRLAFAR